MEPSGFSKRCRPGDAFGTDSCNTKGWLDPPLSVILPTNCKCSEVAGEIAESHSFPEEVRAVNRATPARKREFVTGRACARVALSDLGLAMGPIPRGANREPQWPAGIVGSITHCAGYVAAAVARTDDIRGIGMDAEPNEHLEPEVIRMIAVEEEIEKLRALGTTACWDRLLFSAKESVFKVWFPMTERWLDFRDVNVTFLPEAGCFHAEIRVCKATGGEAHRGWMDGKFVVRERVLLSAVVLEPDGDLIREILERRKLSCGR